MPTYLGDRVTLEAAFRDSDHNLYDPDEVIVEIYDGRNGLDCTLKYSLAEVTKVSTGIYEVEYDIPLTACPGSWRVVWTGILGGGQKRERMGFSIDALD